MLPSAVQRWGWQFSGGLSRLVENAAFNQDRSADKGRMLHKPKCPSKSRRRSGATQLLVHTLQVKVQGRVCPTSISPKANPDPPARASAAFWFLLDGASGGNQMVCAIMCAVAFHAVANKAKHQPHPSLVPQSRQGCQHDTRQLIRTQVRS